MKLAGMERPSPSWLQAHADGVTLSIAVQPGAKKTAFAGQYADFLRVRVAAPPVDGAANSALIEFLAEYFSLRRRDVCIVHGMLGRRKTVRLAGLTAAETLSKLQTILAE